MDSQPQNPNPHTTSQNHKQKRNMERLKKAVFGAMDLDSTTPLSEETKKCIEKRLLQLFPVIRTPDHPPYAAMILDAIKALNENRGSSEKSLSEFIKSNYDVPWAHSSYLSHHLCKLAQNGDIVVTSDDHYMIPTLNPNPKSRAKEKRQKPKCHRGRGRHGNYRKEAVVEEKIQLGEQEKVEIEELSQAQKHENNVIDEAKEQDCQVNEGKNQSQGQQNQVRPELLQSCPNDDDCATLTVIPVESSSPRMEDEEEESNDDDHATLIVIPVESSSPRVEDEEEEESNDDDDCATLMVKPVESSSPRVEDEEEESNDDDCATLMVIPVESSSARVEDEEEESVEKLQKQQKRRKSPFDSLPALNPQPDFEKQQPQSQHQGRASIPEENRDTGSLLLPLGPPQHTLSPHRGRGRPPKPQPDTITRDEALVHLQDESYQQHPPQNRGRGRPRRPKPDEETAIGEFFTSQNLRQGRPRKPKPDAEITIEDFSTSRNLRRGRPPKPKPDAEITIEEFSTSRNLRRGRPPKRKSDAETMTGGFSASQNLRRGTRCSKRKPHFDTTMENL